MPRTAWLWVTLLAFLWNGPAAAAPPEVEVSFDGTRLEFLLDAVVAAPPDAVRAVVLDYDRLDRVLPMVVASRPLNSTRPGVDRVFTLMRGCILLFCREMEHTIDVRPVANGWSSGITVPELSRVRRGQFSWLIEPARPGMDDSRVQIYGYFEPAFHVPRFLGAALVRARVESELRDSVRRIERAANERRARQADAAADP